MYPEMVLSTRALPVSASMYSSTHFRQWAEEEEEEGEGEGEEEEEEGRRMRGVGRGGGREEGEKEGEEEGEWKGEEEGNSHTVSSISMRTP